MTKDNKYNSKKERYVAEKIIQEFGVVEELTDLLLEDDKEALFEERWKKYEFLNPNIRFPFIVPSSITLGLLIGFSFSNPWLIPLIPVPKIVSTIAYNKYKKSKKQELTNSAERKKFKI